MQFLSKKSFSSQHLPAFFMAGRKWLSHPLRENKWLIVVWLLNLRRIFLAKPDF